VSLASTKLILFEHMDVQSAMRKIQMPEALGPMYAELEFMPEKRAVSISKKEGEFIYTLIKSSNLNNTLEVGLAFGCSAMYIMSATGSRHYAIDVYQSTRYNSMGIANLRKLGLLDNLVLLEDFSHFALPDLARRGTRLDFAFIDGGHRFDDIFLDFYYVDLMTQVGGLVILHDTWMWSTQYIKAWIKTNRSDYKIHRCPIESFVLLEKVGYDTRPWYDFHGFWTLSSAFTQWKFRRSQ
jgi:predicted O-methyltransferase YrrM